MRIDAISKNEKGDLGGDTKGALLLLDLLDKEVRKVVRASASAAEAYRERGRQVRSHRPRSYSLHVRL